MHLSKLGFSFGGFLSLTSKVTVYRFSVGFAVLLGPYAGYVVMLDQFHGASQEQHVLCMHHQSLDTFNRRTFRLRVKALSIG